MCFMRGEGEENLTRGGGVLPIMAYTGRLSRKGYLFQASGIWKGRDFTSLGIGKGMEISHLGFWKGLLIKIFRADAIYGCIISVYEALLENEKKTFCFKSMPWLSGIWKGYFFSWKGIRKGYKMVYKRVRGRSSGRSLPVQNFVEYPPPPPPRGN